MPETAMTSMQRTKAEIKKAESPEVAGLGNRDKYPWGLEIDLDDSSLKKLGIDVTKYTVNENVQVFAKAKIERISQSSNMEGSNNSMTIQITHLQFKSGNPKPNSLSQTKSSESVEKDLDKMGLLD